VVLDATFISPDLRRRAEALATRQGVAFDGAWLEAVCEWDGEPGALFAALSAPVFGKAPLVTAENGGIRVHDWDKENASLRQRWHARTGTGKSRGGNRSKFGRSSADSSADPSSDSKTSPSDSSTESKCVDADVSASSTLTLPTLPLSSEEGSQGDSEPHIPSEEEVRVFCEQETLANPIPPDYGAEKHALWSENNAWVINGGLIDWKAKLRRLWARYGREWLESRKKKETAAGREGVSRVSRLNAELETADAGRRREIRRELRELEAVA